MSTSSRGRKITPKRPSSPGGTATPPTKTKKKTNVSPSQPPPVTVATPTDALRDLFKDPVRPSPKSATKLETVVISKPVVNKSPVSKPIVNKSPVSKPIVNKPVVNKVSIIKSAAAPATAPSAAATSPAAKVVSTVTPAQSSPATDPTPPAATKQFIFKDNNFVHSSKNTAGKKTRVWKNLKQILVAERGVEWPADAVTYGSIDAPPSFKPAKKYADITGLPGKYTDPQTKMRYATSEEFARIRVLPSDIVAGYLALRKANAPV